MDRPTSWSRRICSRSDKLDVMLVAFLCIETAHDL